MSHLHVQIIAGRDLAAKDKNGLSDPFCKLVLADLNGKEQEVKEKTKVISKSLNPQWNASFKMKLSDKVETLFIRCYDKDPLKVDFMGEIAIDIKDLKPSKEGWVTLGQRRGGKKESRISGELNIAVHLVEEGADAPAFNPASVNISGSNFLPPEHEAQLVAAKAAEEGDDSTSQSNDDEKEFSTEDKRHVAELEKKRLEEAAKEAADVVQSAKETAEKEVKEISAQLEKEASAAAEAASKAVGSEKKEAQRKAEALAEANKQAEELIAEEAKETQAALERKAVKAKEAVKSAEADLKNQAAVAAGQVKETASRGLDTAEKKAKEVQKDGLSPAVMAGAGAILILLLAIIYKFVL